MEEVVSKDKTESSWKVASNQRANKPLSIQEISLGNELRIDTNDQELNRVLGGGIVPGSLVLLAGDPGIGKSTLLLQVSLGMQRNVLYVTGEESDKQIRMRAERLGLKDSPCKILTETNTQNIFQQAVNVDPDLVVIDSIQTLQTNTIDSSSRSVSQIRACTAELMKYAKESGTPIILIGHINKDGHIAGPKILEHMVDVVLQFEGDRNHVYRIYDPIKIDLDQLPN